MTPRPRLLFLCQTLPYPPDGGVQIRAFHLLRLLATEYEVHASCFYRKATRSTPRAIADALQGLRSHAEPASVEAFPIPQEHSYLRLIWDHGRSVLRRRPYTVFTHESTSFRDRLRSLLRGQEFDLIHVDSLDLSYYLSMLPSVPIVCDHHNVESVLLERRAQQASNSALRRYMLHQAHLTRREEAQWCPRVALNLAVSEEDRRELLERAPGAASMVVPNGVDTTTFRPAPSENGGIVFVGGYNWFPNREGMEHFAEDILPKIREKDSTIRVVWVGRASGDVVEDYRTKWGVEMTGYVDDIRPHVARAGCFIVPLRVGGGTRLKILDAWAMGKAVVSTSLGCEGLEARDGENILIRDSPDGFADAVWEVLTNRALRSRLGAAGRATAEELYDWNRIGERMLSAYRNLSRDAPNQSPLS